MTPRASQQCAFVDTTAQYTAKSDDDRNAMTLIGRTQQIKSAPATA
jgi:hypothetical protein